MNWGSGDGTVHTGGGGRGSGLGGVNLPVLRGHNEALVLSLLRAAGPTGLGRAELAARTGLTPQAVSKITARLGADGLVAEAGRAASTGGKPRTLLRLVPQARHAVGVHLDRDELRAVRVDLAGVVVAETGGPLDFAADPEAVVEAVVRAVARVREVPGTAVPVPVLGAGVAAPGPLDHRTGVMGRVTGCPRWEGFPLRAVLEARLGLPVLLDKDTNAAAAAHPPATTPPGTSAAPAGGGAGRAGSGAVPAGGGAVPAGGGAAPSGGSAVPAGGGAAPSGRSAAPAGGGADLPGGSAVPSGGGAVPPGGSAVPAGGGADLPGSSAAPGGGGAAPAGGSAARAGGGAGPAGGGAVPSGGSAAPEGGSAVPPGRSVAPGGVGADPASGSAVSAGGGVVPSGGSPVSAGGGAVPSGRSAVPAGGEAVPAGGSAVPSGGGAVPLGGSAVPPGGGDVLPGGSGVPAGGGAVPAGGGAVPLGRLAVPATPAGPGGGPGEGARTSVYLHVGTGLGAGLRLGGEVYRGTRSAAGEFGHQVLSLDGPPCRCGARGCAEVLCLAAVARGDLPAAARIVGEGAANLVALLDVDHVVLGGRVVERAPDVFVAGVRAVLTARALTSPAPTVALAVAGVAEGAAELALAPFFGRP
ncbi:ROK family protein [Streptomyces sp. NPDC058662]|uniref:ROK family protein n=1 Tax=Streptomyces sp. NPDC058662 TaxID=3346583 RepID=UPI00364754E4